MRYINYPIFQFGSAATITYISYLQALEMKREAAERKQDIIEDLKHDDSISDDSKDTEENLNNVTGLVNKSSSRTLLEHPNHSQFQQFTLKLIS